MTYAEIMIRLRAQKRRKRLTQEDIARKLGVSQPSVSNSMNSMNISLRNLIRLCDALGLSVTLEPTE